MTALRMLALGLLIAGRIHAASDAGSLRPQPPASIQSWGWWRPATLAGGNGAYAAAGRTAAPDPAWASNVAPLASTVTAPAATPTGSSPGPQPYSYDAYIDMGQGPFASSSALTGGNAQGWWNSSLVQGLYGHTPTPQEQADFTGTVLKEVQRTFDLSHVPVSLTTAEGAAAAHSVSVVSNTQYPGYSDAVGIANIGGDGFSFIDKFKYASSVKDLEWAVAHNLAHELMHTFGGDHHDTTGNFLDTATISWDKLIDPKLIFGPESVSELLSKDFRSRDHSSSQGAERVEITPSPVPEPAALLAWGLGVAGALLVHHQRRRRAG